MDQRSALARNKTWQVALMVMCLVFVLGGVGFAEDSEEDSLSAASLSSQSISSQGMSGPSDLAGHFHALGLSNHQFGVDELNFSQGAVSFQEVDLRLPGKNGLDLVISRSYNSRRYKSDATVNPTTDKLWGSYIGKGWSLNVGMRAYLFKLDADNVTKVNKVAVDFGGSVNIFEYDAETGHYVNDRPGAYDYVVAHYESSDLTKLVLHSEDNKEYEFETFFCYAAIEPRRGFEGYIRDAFLCGFQVTRIKDKYDNQIEYEYEIFSGELDKNAISKITVVMGDNAGNYFFDCLRRYYPLYAYAGYGGTFLKMKKITDTYGREVTFGYETGQKDRVNSIHYTNVNGGSGKIQYSYNENDLLSKVQVGSLPESKYEYTYFSPSGVHDQLKGYILSNRVSPFGANINYAYTQGKRESSTSILYPIVEEKKTINGSDEWVFQITYPTYDDGAAKFSKYSPVWDPDEEYTYFQTVSIDNPSQIQDEEYIFENGLLTSRVQGKFKTETQWDYSYYRKVKVTSKVDNTIKSEQIIESYDAYNNPTSILIKKGTSSFLRKTNTFYTDSTYINQNLLHLVKTQQVTDLSENKTRSQYFEYYDTGKPKDIYKGTNSSGTHLKRLTYDSIGRIESEVNYGGQAGNLTVGYRYSGGESGSDLQITKTANGKSATMIFEGHTGKLKQATDANGKTSRYAYDNYGRLLTATAPDGTQKTKSYASDLKSFSTTFEGKTVTKYIDNLGRLKYIDRPNGEEDIKVDYHYGGLVSDMYKGAYPSTWTLKKHTNYDTYLRKTSVDSTDWGTTQYAYDDTNRTFTITDSKGRSTVQSFDELGRETQTRLVDGTTIQNTLNAFSEGTELKDPRDLFHKAEYDDRGQLIKSYYTKHEATPTQKRYEYEYYDNGTMNNTKVYNDSGSLHKTYSYIYDIENRLTTIKEGTVDKEILTYDGNSGNRIGRLAAAENSDVKTDYIYDDMGRVSQETTTVKPINKTYNIQTSYKNHGGYDKITYTDGKQIAYDYNALFRMTGINYNSKDIMDYTYNPNGTLSRLTYGNGMKVEYTYTKEILVTQMTVKNAANTVIYQQTFTYDNVGRVTQTTYENPISNESMTRVYEYTNKDELSAVDINDQEDYYTYTYDNNGNAIKFSMAELDGPVVTKRNVDEHVDQITQQTYVDDSNRRLTFAYDAEGNMTQKNHIQGDVTTATQYVYNYQGQLAEVKQNSIQVARYGYNHKRERVYNYTPGSHAGAGHKYYYWDSSGRIIGEGHTTLGDHIVRYIYSGNEKVAMIRPNQAGQEEIYYFINNLQGTPIFIMDAAGSKVSKIQMDEWGNMGFSIASNNEVNYTGKKKDPVTGLYYFNQRYYDSEIGRFLTEDPAGQGINPYAYCGNNPMGFVDPYGLWQIGFNIMGFGISVGDEEVSVTFYGVQAGVDFSDGSVFVGAEVALFKFEFGEAEIGGSVQYRHNLMNGGQDKVLIDIGVDSGNTHLGYKHDCSTGTGIVGIGPGGSDISGNLEYNTTSQQMNFNIFTEGGMSYAGFDFEMKYGLSGRHNFQSGVTEVGPFIDSETIGSPVRISDYAVDIDIPFIGRQIVTNIDVRLSYLYGGKFVGGGKALYYGVGARLNGRHNGKAFAPGPSRIKRDAFTNAISSF